MKKLRIGIFGVRRGSNFFDAIAENGGEVVALCDKNENYIAKAKDELGNGVVSYSDFDEFLNHPMDAVILSNYFHEHTPYAIRCLEKNIHVLSECIASSTMAESVALVKAAEKSKAFYMLCENYPFMIFNQEMKKIYESGNLGKVLYAEGEYNHPGDPAKTEGKGELYDSLTHWRNYLPKTYYITHSLAPLMLATGSMPKRVTAMPVYCPPAENAVTAGFVADRLAVVTILNDDNSVFKVFGHSTFGGHENSYRICGTKGQVENVRGLEDTISILYNEWELPEGVTERYTSYKVEPEAEDEEYMKKAGHGGGDYYVIKHFFNCLRTNTRPEMDEYFATILSSVAILGHKSVMAGGTPFDIPDFHLESDRAKYENDNASPFYYSDGRTPNIPCCSNPDYKPTQDMVNRFEEAIRQVAPASKSRA